MDSENPTLKWSLAAVGVVVVCFCLGYFVFGTKGAPTDATPAVTTPSPEPTPGGLQITAVESQGLQVEDITAEKEAARKRKEAAERAREEAKLKAADPGFIEASPSPDPDETLTDPDEDPTKSKNKKRNPDEDPSKTEPDPAKPDVDPMMTEPDKTKSEGDKPKVEPDKPKTEGEKSKTESEKTVASKNLFRVRIGGAKSTRDDAEKLVAELRGRGYTPTIIADQRKGKTIYHVQAGAFSDSDGAERRKKELENNGYDARVN